MPWPTTTTFDVARMKQRLSSGYCRNVALCEAPITVCSPLPPPRCEPFTTDSWCLREGDDDLRGIELPDDPAGFWRPVDGYPGTRRILKSRPLDRRGSGPVSVGEEVAKGHTRISGRARAGARPRDLDQPDGVSGVGLSDGKVHLGAHLGRTRH